MDAYMHSVQLVGTVTYQHWQLTTGTKTVSHLGNKKSKKGRLQIAIATMAIHAHVVKQPWIPQQTRLH
jgi:hypothetical protein